MEKIQIKVLLKMKNNRFSYFMEVFFKNILLNIKLGNAFAHSYKINVITFKIALFTDKTRYGRYIFCVYYFSYDFLFIPFHFLRFIFTDFYLFLSWY